MLHWMYGQERTAADQRQLDAAERLLRTTGHPRCRRHWHRSCLECRADADYIDPALEEDLIRRAKIGALLPAEVDRLLAREMPPEMESVRRRRRWLAPAGHPAARTV